MDRGIASPLVLLIGSLAFLVWSVVLISTPGGSGTIEPIQLMVSGLTTVFAGYALRKRDPALNRRCRYLLVAFAVFGIVVVLGLAADQRSSRTWARLGWGALIVGYVGAVIAWIRLPAHRVAVSIFAIVGAILIAAGAGLTFNCDPSVQRTWCDPDYEQEQALAEMIEVDGELERLGRAGGSVGAASVTFFIPEGAEIAEVTDPPGEWTYEERPPQSIETERGRYVSEDERFSDCRLDVKVEQVPAGNRETIYVQCGIET